MFTSSCTYCISKRLVSKILSGKYCSLTTDSLKYVACRLSLFHLMIFERSKSGNSMRRPAVLVEVFHGYVQSAQTHTGIVTFKEAAP